MSLRNQVKSGVKWTTASTATLAVIAIVKVSVLTRFLDKADFGLMAIVMFIMGIMELFNDMGLTSAILHKQDISKKQYASLYWINWFASILLYGVLFLITPLVAAFYNQPLLNNLIPLLGLNLLLAGLGRQFKTIEQKHLLFNMISIVDIIAAFLSLGLSVILAVKGYGVYALVYSLLFQTLFSNFSFFIIGIKKYGLLIYFRFSETKSFLKIGGYQIGGQVVNYFNRDLDILLIGKFFSPEILGSYSLAKQLVFRPMQLVSPILIKVATPTLALYQNNKQSLKQNYLKLISIVSTISIPLYVGLMVFAPWIILVLYGNGFEEIILIVRILSIYMIIRSIGNPIGSLVIATGRTDLEFIWNLVALLVMPIFIYIGAQYNIIGVTVSITLAMVILFIPSWRILVFKLTGASLGEYVKAIISIDPRNIKK